MISEGEIFGRWTVVCSRGLLHGGSNEYFLCKCLCGTQRDVRGTALLTGKTKSCGCRKSPAKEAKAVGHRVCPHCQVDKRIEDFNARASACLECAREKDRARQSQEREKRKEYAVQWRKQNPEKARNGVKKAKRKKPALYGGISKRKRDRALLKDPLAERAKRASRLATRRARNKGALGKHTREDIEQIYRQQGGCCFYCGVDLSDGFHADHIVPLSRGGSNWASNICCACALCNLRKGALLPEEFIEKMEAQL